MVAHARHKRLKFKCFAPSDFRRRDFFGLFGSRRENVVLHHYVTGADPVSKLGGLVGTVTTIPGSADLGHTRDDLRQVI